MGADEVIVNYDGADVVGPVRELTGGRGADVVIEAVGLPEVWQLAHQAAAPRRRGELFRRLPERHGSPARYQPAALFRADLQGQLPSHAGADPQGAGRRVSRGYVSAKDLVNRVEPLTNLLEVMQHLMSHNGHLKTAIIP